jgi:hypothetical protein
MSDSHTPDDAAASGQGFVVGWTLLASYPTESEALLVEGMLQNEGVECALESRLFNQEPVSLGVLGMVRLFVREHDSERARHLLDDPAGLEPIVD